MTDAIENQIKTQIEGEIVQFIDAENVLGLFPSPAGDRDITLEKLVWRYLKDVAEASLTTRGWAPAKTKAYVKQFAQRIFSSGLEYDMEWMDWKLIEKMGIIDAGFEKIAKKPGKQMSHYFFTGMALDTNDIRRPRPVLTNYNYLTEAGTANGSLGRPLQAGNAAGGFWGVVTAMILAIETAVGTLVSKGFNKSSLIAFYPRSVESTMIHKLDTGGSGLISPKQYFNEVGISDDRLIVLDDVLLPTGEATPVAPTKDDFDIIIVDAAEVRVLYPTGENVGRPWANVFTPNPGSARPKLKLETGMTSCPIFIPKEIKSEGKIYKGVYVINGIDYATS